ncbi:MAG: carbohydrate ABC transporter permease [Clostridiales bacterium]|nr:carbohydrate ABC transporter permease [Clostridiales bacterium]
MRTKTKKALEGTTGVVQKSTWFDYMNNALMILLSLCFIYPIVMTLAQSFSDAKAMVGKTVFLFPVGFSLDSYKQLLSDISILRYYWNTIVYAGLGTFLTLTLTGMLAYPLTARDFKGKRVISVMLLITMFFGGGMIPTYLVYKDMYHLTNTLWVMILPGAVSAWNVIIFKNFFNSIPVELREAAQIDGAGHFRILFQIVMPLSKPLLATIGLFTIVGHWNGYFNALLYLDSADKFPIQMFLRKILVLSEISSGADLQNLDILRQLANTNPTTVKAAATIITIIPILCVYPFLQKYFTKGMMLGSVKS